MNIARIISKCCSTKTIAAVLDEMLSEWDNNDSLTEAEANLCSDFHHALCQLCPNAVELAMQDVQNVSHEQMLKEMNV